MRQAARVALDMESDGFFHYRERISLIQLATPEEVLLLDPLSIRDLSALGVLLSDGAIRKILHGADYDIRSFDREYGFHFLGLYDTAVAIQLLNPEPAGLGRALERYLGVKLNKTTRLQRSDWSRRPLPADALDYAAGDVAHLARLHDLLEGELQAKGRGEWMAEECALMEQIRFEPPSPPEENCFSVKGTFDLSPEELAVFREFYLLREQISERMDRPPFKVISSEALLSLARDPQQPLERVPNANSRQLKALAGEIRMATARGRKAKPLIHPSKLKRSRNPWHEAARVRWRAYMDARKEKAQELNIAPSVLWPARSLEQMALNPDLCARELEEQSQCGVRDWQRKVLGPALARLSRG